jgi:hypothetical protein
MPADTPIETQHVIITCTKAVVLSAFPFFCEIRPNEVEHTKYKTTPFLHPFITISLTFKFCVDL